MEPKLWIKLGNGGDDLADEFEISDKVEGLKFLGLDSNPNPVNQYSANQAQDGSGVPLYTTYANNVVTAKFWLAFKDYYDLKLAKHDLARIFAPRTTLRLRTDAEPGKVQYVKPVPYEVAPAVDGDTNIIFSIPFDNWSGYQYSLYRSDEFASHSDAWAMGMNLPKEAMMFTFSTAKFTLFNPSDVAVDPYFKRHDLKIAVNFSGDSLKLTNTTNSTEWAYTSKASKTDNIVLDGINTTLNGSPASSNTDFGNLTLEPGNNTIEVTGASDFTVTFSFPFIYLG